MSFNFEAARAERELKHGRTSVAELLALRAAIDAQLPATSLGDMDIDKELVRQYLATQALQTEVLADFETPVNQKAQVINACAAILESLQKTQEKFYRQERFKKIELALINQLRKWPIEQVEEFMAEYAKTLEDER